MPRSTITIRPATPDDAETIAGLIRELAEYEKLAHEAQPDVEALRDHLSASHLGAGTTPRCEALLAEERTSGRAVGFALFFPNYSTFLTRWGIYLEDLYVRPEARGQGVGFALLQEVARIACERGCGRLEWSVLDWNELALQFYKKLGAQPMSEWTTMRLAGEALHALGSTD